MKKNLLIPVLGAMLLANLVIGDEPPAKSHKLTSVSMRKMADSLHAVIAADRQAYAELIVQRQVADEKRRPSVEDSHAAHRLPLHAEMLRTAAQRIQHGGAEFSYTLRSLWPINGKNGPQTEVEETGLKAVAQRPEENVYVEETLGGRSYFTAIYADRATLPSCVECHNKHERSPRRDFKVNDVMGGIVIRIPLEF